MEPHLNPFLLTNPHLILIEHNAQAHAKDYKRKAQYYKA